MKKRLLLLGMCIALSGCFSRSSAMTQETFATVQIGTPIEVVIQDMGEPYSTDTKNGMEEYVYIERVTTGNRLIYENHYILFVQGGVVVSKTVKQERPPSFDLIYQDDPNHNQYP